MVVFVLVVVFGIGVEVNSAVKFALVLVDEVIDVVFVVVAVAEVVLVVFEVVAVVDVVVERQRFQTLFHLMDVLYHFDL